MKISQHGRVTLYDYEPQVDDVRAEVLGGLTRPAKMLPAKLFYDARGSQLFEEICTLEEYYPTRTEIAILHQYVGEMAALIGPRCRLVELGSGSSLKTHVLLDHLEAPSAYVPIDISKTALLEASQAIAAKYPALDVLAVCADYTQRFELPEPRQPARRTVAFFPGSTIGNLERDDALAFLRRIAGWCGRGGGLLIGVDLKKDRPTLEAAYNDRRGVTAAFNLNLLHRINRELGADFDPDAFRHLAIYDEPQGRIEMRLISRRPQTVTVDGQAIRFDEGEWITTEYSHKYSLPEFERLAAAAGFAVQHVWTDAAQRFSVQYLVAA
ncbi:MAG TPA: L-histidine N(alpha)-methyltransferase [Chloroflexota bacterium]|nr:L-histidine N(alpha)-methyltransferase [Chloroflexota bacterium]